MKKDKQKDLVRSILPSTKRKGARDDSRIINRRTRHRNKQALNQINPDDEYDESEFYGKTSKIEARHKSEMKYRVSSRRNGDKLGPIMRVARHLKKTSNNDSEAHEKLTKLIEPGKNLITRHAMGHAEWELDCPEARFYRPLETERDKKFRESRYPNRRGKVVWGKRKFKKIIKRMIQHHHKKLNYALKHGGLLLKNCTVDDDCTTEYTQTMTHHEIFDASYFWKWRRLPVLEYNKAKDAGEKVRIRRTTKKQTRHDISCCQNRLIATVVDDYLVIAKKLAGFDGTVREKDFDSHSGYSVALREIKIVVDKYNL